MRKHIFFGSLALVVAACASAPDTGSLDQRLAVRGWAVGEPVKRVQNYRINGFNSLDRNNVIINTGPSSAYLVTVRRPCEGLDYAESVAFSTTVGNLTDKDQLLVRGNGGFVERCPILGLRELERIPRERVQG